MHEVELVLGLLLAVVVVAAVADRIRVPYPMALLFAGMVMGLAPFIPNVTIDPELVLLVLLAPALFSAAIALDWSAFQELRRPILSLAIRLVLTSTACVAIIAMLTISGMDWSTAIVLGAVVSPPDAVATLSIARRLGIPSNVLTILEGESLVNDATALVLYRVAVAAVVSGGFSLWSAAGQFVVVSVFGISIGLMIGFALFWFSSRLVTNPAVSSAVSLLTPIGAYLIAEEAGGSGVLAVVTAGLVTSRQTLRAVSSQTRVQVVGLWQIVEFIVEGFAFLVIGLQLPIVIDGISDEPVGELVWSATVVVLTVVLVRIVWVFFQIHDDVITPAIPVGNQTRARRRTSRLGLPAAVWVRFVLRLKIKPNHRPQLKGTSVIAWSGLRGIVTLATALALPYTIDGGTAFPHRDLIIFLAFCVILATLVGQGVTLPFLVRRVRFPPEPDADATFRESMVMVIDSGISRLDQLRHQPWVTVPAADEIRTRLGRRRDTIEQDGTSEGRRQRYQEDFDRLAREVEEAERATIRRLAETNRISETMRRRLERRLDLQQITRSES